MKILGFDTSVTKKTVNPKLSYDTFKLFENWQKERKSLSKKIKKNLNTIEDYVEFHQVCRTYLDFLFFNKEPLKVNKVDISPMADQLKQDIEFLECQIKLLGGKLKGSITPKAIEDNSKEIKK